MYLVSVIVFPFGGVERLFAIRARETATVLLFAAFLLGGVLRGKAMLKYVLEAAYEGLSDKGWLKLSLNWGLFFLVLAAANEVMRAVLSFETWLTVKVWGVTLLTFLFAMANIPMLMRHGLSLGDDPPEKPAGDL